MSASGLSGARSPLPAVSSPRSSLVAVLLLCAPLAGCPRPLGEGSAGGASSSLPATLRLFLGGVHVATIEERVREGTVERTSRLVGTSDDVARLRVSLDERGFPRHATYQRQGPHGERQVTLTRQGSKTTLRTRHGEHLLASERPPALLETLHHLRPTSGTEVVFVDVSSGEILLGSVRADGEGIVALDDNGAVLARAGADPVRRVGPGRFLEQERSLAPPSERFTLRPRVGDYPGAAGRVRLSGLEEGALASLSVEASGQRALDDRSGGVVLQYDSRYRDTSPPRAADRRAAPFFESDDDAVRAFARQHAPSGVASADALSLANAIHERLNTREGGGPPSAKGTLTRWTGDCDDATALLVAALRASGHAARAVVGYRHHDGALVPHAWAEVYDGNAWLPVDALVPGLGPFSSHLKLFEGLGSPFTMGRVLGALRVDALPAIAGMETAAAATR